MASGIKMKIQFEADFISRYVFQPIYSSDGRLLAVEILSRFDSLDGDLAMPTEIGVGLLTPRQRVALFNEQLLLIEQYASWFIEHQVLLSINIEQSVAELIVNDRHVAQRLQRLPFMVLEISEGFPQLSAGKKNVTLCWLSERFTLWLDDFGSGKAPLNALYDGLFDYVKIDRRFYWQLFAHQGYDMIIDSLLKNINLLCHGTIVDGIEDKHHFDKLIDAEVFGLQGFLWPSVSVDNLDSLHPVPEVFNREKQ